MNKEEDKRGISQIIYTIIMVVFVLVAVGIVWGVIQNIISQEVDDIFLAGLTLDAEIKSVEIDGENILVNVIRDIGKGNLIGIKFIFFDGENSENQEREVSLKELEGMTFNFTLVKLNVAEVEMVSIALIYLSGSGEEIISKITNSRNIQSGVGETYISEPKPATLNEIPVNADIVYIQNPNDIKFPAGFGGPFYIYVTDRYGNNSLQITSGTPRFFDHIAVSYDRKYIIAAERFAVEASPRPIAKLILFDLENDLEYQLLPEFYFAGEGGVTWDSNGFIYAAATEIEGGNEEVYKIKFDGTQLTQLTNTPEREADVGISEDGSIITYVKVALDQGIPITEIWSANSDGTNHNLVYRSGQLGVASAHDPEVLNNDKIIFTVYNVNVPPNWPNYTNTAHDVYSININGTGLTRLTQPGPISIIPNIKGNEIIYYEISETDYYLGASFINADGTGYRRIKEGSAFAKWIP